MLNVIFFDVGYADSILLNFPDGDCVLVDAGTQASGEHLISALKKMGITKINKAILTHPHKNHFGGFLKLMAEVPIEKFYTNGDDKNAEEGYAELLEEIKKRNIPVEKIRAQDVINMGRRNSYLKIINPQELTAGTNGNSLAVWLKYQQTSFLLTADIQKKQQRLIFEHFPEIKFSQCVQIPHHGGEVDNLFLKNLSADFYVVSTGENEYGKPLLDQIQKVKDKLLRTDQEGMIQFQSDGNKIRRIHERKE